MKISNLNIPASPENTPVRQPDFAAGANLSEKIYCRDPYILLYGGRYYLYHRDGDRAICCRVSDDLERWSASMLVFTPPQPFHGKKDCFWAPECHFYKGNFYIFTSVWSETTQKRCISVYRADNPLGPFEDIASGRITPADWDAIDGTLYVDGAGQPWMVFVHEWVSMPRGVGAMCAAKLSDDLTHFISEPVQLFLADEPEWARAGVTDGPYLYTTEKGTLLMIWSNFDEKGYVIAQARAKEGRVDGEWEHIPQKLYAKGLRPGYDAAGGHAMIFRTKEGALKIVFHSPNETTENDFEHVVLKDLEEKDGLLHIAE